MITHATTNDLPQIYTLFEEAIEYIRKNHYIGWTTYDKNFLQQDLANGHLYKIVKEEIILGVFSTCYADPLIWRSREKGDALYLHRIVSNRKYNEPVFQLLLNWSKAFAKEKGLRYLRMDTWAQNSKIVSYYQRFGFSFIENYTTPNSTDLPEQHRNLHVALLELAL